MKRTLETPLGIMDCNCCDDVFLQKIYRYSNSGEVFVSIKVKNIDSVFETDFSFIKHVLNNLDCFLKKSSDYLRDSCLEFPSKFGYELEIVDFDLDPIVSNPEVTFWGESKWSILFSEGDMPICKPYGILVNFDKDDIVDFDNLSNAEEI